MLFRSAGAQASLSTNKTTANGQNNSFLADPSDDATDKVTAAVTKLADKVASGIRTEALISTAILSLYLLVVVMGLARVFYSSMRGGKTRAEGAPTYAGDVAPGMVEDNTDAANRRSVRNSNYEMNHIASSPAIPAPREPPPTDSAPPAYEKRFPAFQSRFPGSTEEEEEEAYQNEKLGYAQTTNEQIQHQNRNNPFMSEKNVMF